MSLARLELGSTCICSVHSPCSQPLTSWPPCIHSGPESENYTPGISYRSQLLPDLRACACRVKTLNSGLATYAQHLREVVKKKKKKSLLAPNASHAGCVVLRQFLTRCVITLAESSLARFVRPYGLFGDLQSSCQNISQFLELCVCMCLWVVVRGNRILWPQK